MSEEVFGIGGGDLGCFNSFEPKRGGMKSLGVEDGLRPFPFS